MLKLFFLLAAWCAATSAQRGCSRDRMRQCEDGLMRAIQRRVNDMTRTDMASHCVGVRDDFNCLLRETRCLTSESDRNRNGDSLRNAIKYIRDGCDTAGASWRDSSCYVGDAMKTCESSYPLGGVQYASYNPETCRKYNLFSDCVRDAIRNRCSPSDEAYTGQYLVDTAQDLAWNCGEQTSTGDWDRGDRDRNGDRYGDRERDRYGDRDRNNDRDRGYDRNSGGSYGYNRNGGYSGGSSDVTCCRNERCDRSRMSQCRDSLSRTVDSRATGYQDSSNCRRARDDFNCLLWQTSNCMSRGDRDRDNDLFRKAKDFISRNCDNYGRWSENSCYKSSEMMRCETQLSNTRGGANYEACRSFLGFRDCVQDELQRRCTREDDLYQGSYLLDKAQELAWQCGSDRGNNDRGNNDRGSDRFSDRDYDRNRNGGYNQYDRQQDAYPAHLDNDDADCVARISTETDRCKTQMDDRRRELYTENDYDERNRITCCSIRRYRDCLYESARRCNSDRNRVVESLMAGYRHQLDSDNCRKVYDYQCSAAPLGLLRIPYPLLIACFFAILAFTHRR